MLQKVLMVIAVVTAVVFGQPAVAATITYDFWLAAPNGYAVTDLVLYARDANQDSTFLPPVELTPSGVQRLSYSLGFEPTSALVVGITERDRDDWWDIVMFTSDAFATSALGRRYDALFPTARNLGHNVLTPLLQQAHDGDASALDAVTGYLRGSDAASAYFDPRGSFSIIQFSTVGPPIGGNVPEPGTLALLSLGIACVVYPRRGKSA